MKYAGTIQLSGCNYHLSEQRTVSHQLPKLKDII